jgi:hypothetical protein
VTPAHLRAVASTTTEKRPGWSRARCMPARHRVRRVVTMLEAAGTDVDKKNATSFTVAEFEAGVKVWQYPDGVCVDYVD